MLVLVVVSCELRWWIWINVETDRYIVYMIRVLKDLMGNKLWNCVTTLLFVGFIDFLFILFTVCDSTVKGGALNVFVWIRISHLWYGCCRQVDSVNDVIWVEWKQISPVFISEDNFCFFASLGLRILSKFKRRLSLIFLWYVFKSGEWYYFF